MFFSLPDPDQEGISLRKVEGGIAAVSKFSGKPMEDVVQEKEKVLRSNLIRDGLKPKMGCLLARYNDPGRTWSFIMVCNMILNHPNSLSCFSNLVDFSSFFFLLFSPFRIFDRPFG